MFGRRGFMASLVAIAARCYFGKSAERTTPGGIEYKLIEGYPQQIEQFKLIPTATQIINADGSFTVSIGAKYVPLRRS